MNVIMCEEQATILQHDAYNPCQCGIMVTAFLKKEETFVKGKISLVSYAEEFSLQYNVSPMDAQINYTGQDWIISVLLSMQRRTIHTLSPWFMKFS